MASEAERKRNGGRAALGGLALVAVQCGALVAIAVNAALVAGVLLLGGAALAFVRARREIAHARAAAALCGGDTSQRLADSLARIGEQLARLRHRTERTHPVTRLPTREQLFAAIEADIAAGCPPRLLGVVRFADFDRLSAFSADAANAALAALGDRLRRAAGPNHFLAHVDRDCFALWFGGAADSTAAARELDALVYAASQEVACDAIMVTPTIEAGLVLHPEDGDDPHALLTRALVALGPPARDEEGRLRLSRPASPVAAREQYALEQDLRQAIDGDQLSLRFQPIVDLEAGRIVAAEALLRWEHPSLGAVSPAHFIPVVEATGQSERFGAWVLNAAVREAKRWRQAGLGDLRVAVNLSACQLLDTALIAKIARTLGRHALAPEALELELTETAAMADAGRTLKLFAELKAMGVALAIDDFGSGYSSLSYLKNLPFDKLKIDREFVRDAHMRRDSLAICRALLALGKGLDLKVLAEGVESADEVAALRALGCTLFQGYYFDRPLAGDDFLAAARDPDWVARRVSPLDGEPASWDRLCA